MGVARASMVVACFLTAACAPAPVPESAASARASDVQAVIVATQLLVGEQRIPIGVLVRNTPVNDATVRLRVFRGSESDPLANAADAPFKGDGLLGKGLYIARVRFGAAGPWQGEVTMRLRSGQQFAQRVPLNVLAAPIVPSPGQAAPRSRNLTRRDVEDVREIDSGNPPDDMHELSIAEAIAQRRPALVVFATPAFCESATCGPQLHAVQQLEPRYRDRLAFIHIEVYVEFRDDPTRKRLNPVVDEWRLRSEPWTFLIDVDGIVRAAFEGATATDELASAVERLLARP